MVRIAFLPANLALIENGCSSRSDEAPAPEYSEWTLRESFQGTAAGKGMLGIAEGDITVSRYPGRRRG